MTYRLIKHKIEKKKKKKNIRAMTLAKSEVCLCWVIT